MIRSSKSLALAIRQALRILLIGISVFQLSSASALACNIPVFRYALERWQADPIDLVIFHDGPLSESQSEVIEAIKKQTQHDDGNANLELIIRQKDEIDDAELQEVWESLPVSNRQDLPVAVLRGKSGQSKTITIWQGKLSQLEELDLLDSPVRTELAQRLLEGDSVVWVVLASEDKNQTKALVEMLEESLPSIAKEIPIPDGIGLPGSELFSPIPLEIHFSVLVIAPDDKQEYLLRQWMTQHSPAAHAAGSPLVMPVFGRGRAIQILSAEIVRPQLVRELSFFLSGACSCQLKDLNPGFDLLMNTNWEQELFGSEFPEIPEPLRMQQDQPATPILVSIPPGSSKAPPEQTGQPVLRSTKELPLASANSHPVDQLHYRLDWLLLMFVSVVVLVVAASSLKPIAASPAATKEGRQLRGRLVEGLGTEGQGKNGETEG